MAQRTEAFSHFRLRSWPNSLRGHQNLHTVTAWYDEELTFLEDRYDKVYVVAYLVTVVYPRYIKAYYPTYDEFWQVSAGPNKLNAYWCYAYGWRTNLDETMVYLLPQSCVGAIPLLSLLMLVLVRGFCGIIFLN